jgi:outer membrane lipoprotein-sorting protein
MVGAASAQEFRDGAALLRAMHDRYVNNWFETLSFKQDYIRHNPDGTNKTEIWYETFIMPGKMRIDFGEPKSANGMLVTDGKMITFQNNQITGTRPFVHILLVLGFDVCAQPPETTIDQVKGLGYDLSKVHEDTWEGQPMYVVGADKGDLRSKQFWVEKKRLLFVRLLRPDEREPDKTDDIRMTDYRKLSKGYVGARIELYIGGVNTVSEIYSDIKTNPELDPKSFDPGQLKPQEVKAQQ